jgi:hypothetical protein
MVNDFQLSADKLVGVVFLRSWFAVSSMEDSLDQMDQPMHVTSTLLVLRGIGPEGAYVSSVCGTPE